MRRRLPLLFILFCAGFAATVAHAQGTQYSPAPVAPPPVSPTTPAIAAPRVGGYAQVRSFWQDNVGMTTMLNRARIGLEGPLPQRFSYRMLVEFQASAGARLPATVSLREAIIRWSPAPFTFWAGEFKTPFSREYLIPVPLVELADLGVVVDSLSPKYDLGIMAEYAWGANATISIGAFNGEGANSIANRDSTTMYGGRVTGRLLPQVNLGASGAHDGPDSLRWGVDVNVQHMGGVVRAEYIERHRRGRANSTDDWGWYVFEAFRATPRLQLVARQEDFQRPTRGTVGRVRGSAFGANFEFAPNRVRLLAEYLRRWSGAQQRRTDSWILQIQGVF